MTHEHITPYPKISDRKVDPPRHSLRLRKRGRYACLVQGCGKTFAQSSGLRAHENVHTKNKPFACGNCPATFSDPSSKTRHVNEIHKMKYVNVCPVMSCRTRIKRGSAFRTHLKRKHNISPEQAKIISLHSSNQNRARTSIDKGIEGLSSTLPEDQPYFPVPLQTWPMLATQTAPGFNAGSCAIHGLAHAHCFRNEIYPELALSIDPELLQRDNGAWMFYNQPTGIRHDFMRNGFYGYDSTDTDVTTPMAVIQSPSLWQYDGQQFYVGSYPIIEPFEEPDSLENLSVY
ncbi:hypothetical protein AX15_007208 [Amanita polypyramis BW_CC]|nr:hypothetical protein AX15_007208 [Amanita polypyramis BW_CC]